MASSVAFHGVASSVAFHGMASSVAFHGEALLPFIVWLCCLLHNVAVVADCNVIENAILITFESFYSRCSVNLVVFL